MEDISLAYQKSSYLQKHQIRLYIFRDKNHNREDEDQKDQDQLVASRSGLTAIKKLIKLEFLKLCFLFHIAYIPEIAAVGSKYASSRSGPVKIGR